MSLIKKPNELIINPAVKILLYGQPGAGKSTFALSAPSPLLLDFDGGVHRVNPKHQTPTVQIGKWADVAEVLKEDLSSFKTLVIDTAGKSLDFMNKAIVEENPKLGKLDGTITLQGYGVRKQKFINFLSQVSLMGKHIVFVAHDREDKDGDLRFMRPELGGSSANDLVKEMDLVGYMQMLDKKRTISFDPTERSYGKNTANLEPNLLLNDLNAPGQNNIQLSQIIEQYINTVRDKKEIGNEYSKLLIDLEGKIGSATSETELNEFVDHINNVNHVWDSKVVAQTMFRKRLTDLGLKYKAGVYEKAEL
jgi:hypothetical protein